jgi:hypothetical protein
VPLADSQGRPVLLEDLMADSRVLAAIAPLRRTLSRRLAGPFREQAHEQPHERFHETAE